MNSKKQQQIKGAKKPMKEKIKDTIDATTLMIDHNGNYYLDKEVLKAVKKRKKLIKRSK